MEIKYEDLTVVAMNDAEVERLGLLCPKKVYFQMETSGSPSVWTDYGEYEVGHTGADIVRCAEEIQRTHEECEEYNNSCGCGDNRRNYYAHIRVIF
jgi:hypothetical protein